MLWNGMENKMERKETFSMEYEILKYEIEWKIL